MPRHYLIKYDPDHPTNVRRHEISEENKENKVQKNQPEYNQVMPGFEHKFPDMVHYDKRLDEVDPNNEEDDGWAEVREAQILARKKMVKDVRLLDQITLASDTSRRDKLRAMEQTYNIATEKVGPADKGNIYNINTLIQVLTGDK